MSFRQFQRSQLHRLVRQWLRQPDQQGLTLLEALVAIMVIGVTASAITPAFVLAVATRIQSQKTEQAVQLARGAVDEARVVMELRQVEDDTSTTPAVESRAGLLPGDAGTGAANTVGAPTTFLKLGSPKCSSQDAGSKPAATEACAVDVDGDGEADFAVQTYRVQSFPDATTTEPMAFDIGVRVYDYSATRDINDDGTTDVTVTDLKTTPASVGPTSDRGGDDDTKRGYRYEPLAVIYTTIFRSESENSLCDYYKEEGSVDPVTKGLECD